MLSVTGTYDDNFYLTSDNPESGWETTISPSLRLMLPVQRFYLNAEGGLDYSHRATSASRRRTTRTGSSAARSAPIFPAG